MQFNQPYNRNDFLNFLRINFLPEDFKQEETSVANPVQFQYTQKVTRLGECESLGLVVYEVKHSSKHDARVGLTKEAFRLLADEFCERAIIFFVPEDDNSNYRFSLIEITLEQKAESARVGRKYSNPHRYSYYLGKGISYYTPNKYLNEYGRVMSVEDLRNRFSVEVLTKAFYQELSDWYAWAIMVVRFPNDLKTLEDNQKYNAEAMIRLITRLIFVWFIKQRHLVPDEFFDEQYIANNLIKGFTPNAKVNLFGKSEESHYYKGILQNLFFAMLNSPITPEGKDTISERRFRNGRGDYDNNKLMRHEDLFINPDKFVELANKFVPFLNGGLFDCLDDKDNGVYIDAFTDREAIAKQLIVPDYLFFGEDVGRNIDLSEWYGDAKKKKVSARGIIDILKRYNFTVEENTPFDQEVSLDPELLGKVFENLLASYNPETQTTARKQTGSFYTPREIVQYMVDESLVAHLKRIVGDDLEPEFRELIQYTDETPDLTAEQKRQIMKALYDCKVLDPACGSGAFPMGMLQQMVHILNRIDPGNTMWKEVMLNNAISETSEVYQNATDEERAEMVADIERSFNESINRPDYARKLYLIENCIYGVDIQPIAIQISKLRFFISLVVDQKTNNNPVDNFGIRPLPNLEAKFVAANTLIGLEKKDANLFDSEAIKQKEKELKEAKHRIFGAKTVKTKRKYKERVAALRTEIAEMLKESGSIGNQEAQQLASWDMFDQHTSSPFFDPEWMFGVGDGFDVVIGNPPYIKEYTDRKAFDGFREKSPYYMGKMDLWYGFACYGIDWLKTYGVLCFIATNNWVTSFGANILRNKVIKETRICNLVDFGAIMMFESASIQTMIMVFQKDCFSDNYTFDYRKLTAYKATVKDAAAILSKTSQEAEYYYPTIKRSAFIDKSIIFSKSAGILEQIESANNIIHLYEKEIAQGIVFPQDVLNKKNQLLLGNDFHVGQGIFVLTNDEKNALSLNTNELSLIKPYYTTDNISRYYSCPNNNYWVIYTDSKFKNPDSLNAYPNIKKHLDRFLSIFTSDNKPYGLHRAREGRFFCNEKIIALRKCVGHPIFSYCGFNCYLSQSFNIIQTDRVNMKYLTGLLNSRLIEFWLKNKGKMQGANYQLDKEPLMQIPIVVPCNETQNLIARLVDYIVFIKAANQQLSDLVSNSTIINFFEKVIDGCVYEIYFNEYMFEREINIVDATSKLLKPISHLNSDKEKGKVILDSFMNIKKTDNPIRNRLELFTLRSPELLKQIIEN